MRALGIAWRVLSVLFEMVVVAAVLLSAREHDTQLILAAVGFVYTTCSAAFGGALLLAHDRSITEAKRFAGLRALIEGHENLPYEQFEEAEAKLREAATNVYINVFGLVCISLMCLIRVITTVG